MGLGHLRRVAGRAVAPGGTALLAVGLLVGCAETPAPGRAVYLTERWCYETLADVDCYTAPQPKADARRVGWFDAIVVE